MRIAEYCIKNPVTAIVINLLFIFIGFFAYHQLQIRVWPKHDIPVVQIRTSYSGASAALVERSITNVLEQQLASVSGIDDVSSTSSQDQSEIKIHLLPSANANDVVSKIREVVSRAQGHLPDDVDTPTVIKRSSYSELAEYALIDPNMSLVDLKDYASLYLEPKFQAVDGVSDLDIWGLGDRQMQINIDPEKMAAYNVSIADLSQSIRNANVSLPGGMVRSLNMNYPVNIQTKIDTVPDYNQVVLSSNQNRVVHVADVAHAQLGTDVDVTHVYWKGKQVIYLNVSPLPDANSIHAYERMKQLVSNLKSSLPKGMQIKNTFDMMKYLLASIKEVYFSIAFAVICVLLVVYLFLGSFRAVLIPTLAIPVSLIGAFLPMWLGGLSINLFTLMALVLAVGLVVDDAIVVLENIGRHQHQGLGRKQAAINGGNEIQFAVMAMTLTLVAVYAPIATITGRFAAIYAQFAITLSAAVLISGLVSLTLTPVMCAYFLSDKTTRLQRWTDGVFDRFAAGYKKILDRILHHRWWVVVILLALLGGGFWIYHCLQHELAPKEDMGLLSTQVALSQGSSIHATHQITQQIAELLQKKVSRCRRIAN